ncbi:MAG TPA: response regulator [Nitrospirota bacterium]|nr:response regulator [Nitrospirota bacterium]
MGTILLIDDNAAFLKTLAEYVSEQYPHLSIQACIDPIKCLSAISSDLDLLLVDLEMPGLDGAKVLKYAVSRGVSKNRIIILSGRDAEYLHKRFPIGSCLAVLNKYEAEQRKVLDMVFKSLEYKKNAKGDSGQQ